MEINTLLINSMNRYNVEEIPSVALIKPRQVIIFGCDNLFKRLHSAVKSLACCEKEIKKYNN